ncbi:MAG: hypothetical protein ABS94_00085 [Variovorax sp. SCN 67-85]|nr:MAG: hypothetical protein ABS94_00085 [Variovorax sp. SCN 67-85]
MAPCPRDEIPEFTLGLIKDKFGDGSLKALAGLSSQQFVLTCENAMLDLVDAPELPRLRHLRSLRDVRVAGRDSQSMAQ